MLGMILLVVVAVGAFTLGVTIGPEILSVLPGKGG